MQTRVIKFVHYIPIISTDLCWIGVGTNFNCSNSITCLTNTCCQTFQFWKQFITILLSKGQSFLVTNVWLTSIWMAKGCLVFRKLLFAPNFLTSKNCYWKHTTIRRALLNPTSCIALESQKRITFPSQKAFKALWIVDVNGLGWECSHNFFL
jgi:hypothetical protein